MYNSKSSNLKHTRLAGTFVTRVKSAFELVMPKSVQRITKFSNSFKLVWKDRCRDPG